MPCVNHLYYPMLFLLNVLQIPKMFMHIYQNEIFNQDVISLTIFIL